MTVNFNDFIQRANETAGLLNSVPDGVRAKLIEVFKILESKTAKSEEKQAKINKLSEGISDENIKGFIQMAAYASIKIADWMTGRLQNEDPSVREACRKTVHLIMSNEFIAAPDNVKRQKLNAIVSGLNENQLILYMKFKKEADEVAQPQV